jgi:hypothetical protein
MKTRTVTVREGELLGPVDWERHNFDSDVGGPARQRVTDFRALVDGVECGESWQATTDGGWPRVGWKDVIAVGMYDGWPHWKPTPSFCLAGLFGPEWHPWYALSGAERIDNGA